MLATAAALCLPGAVCSTFAATRRPLIDVHHHWHSRDLARSWGLDVPDADWAIDRSLAAMDDSGVTTAVLSVTAPGVWNSRDGEASIRLARLCNEGMAQTVRDHRSRFGFFASLALPMIAASVAELGYSLDQLKANGVGLLSSYDGKYLGDPLFAPVFEELNHRHAVVYVHPSVPQCCAQLLPEVDATAFEEPSDTTRTIESLLVSGALARWNNISFIFAHGGGTLPFVADRILSVVSTGDTPQKDDLSPLNMRTALARLYFDCASVVNPAAFAALMNFTTPERILFGSDFPYHPVGAAVGALRAMEQRFGLNLPDMQAIEYASAQRLFPQHA
jgi:predicted TIM-barrel fold metal-dependent hydrolase